MQRLHIIKITHSSCELQWFQFILVARFSSSGRVGQPQGGWGRQAGSAERGTVDSGTVQWKTFWQLSCNRENGKTQSGGTLDTEDVNKSANTF